MIISKDIIKPLNRYDAGLESKQKKNVPSYEFKYWNAAYQIVS